MDEGIAYFRRGLRFSYFSGGFQHIFIGIIKREVQRFAES